MCLITKLGVMGCPNLPSAPSPSPFPQQNTAAGTTAPRANDDDGAQAQDDRGVLFVAVRGHGTYKLPLHPILTPAPTAATSAFSTPHGVRQLSMPHMAPHELSFLGRKGPRGTRHQRARRDASRRARRARAHGFAGKVCCARARRWWWLCLLAVVRCGPRPRR
jgi:hypothetical protein